MRSAKPFVSLSMLAVVTTLATTNCQPEQTPAPSQTLHTHSAALTLNVRSPDRNETTVQSGAQIDATFDNEVALGTVPGNAFVRGSVSGTVAFTPTSDNNVLTLTPAADFVQGERVTVTLTQGLEDVLLDPLDQAHQWQFYVAPEAGFGNLEDGLQALGNSDSRAVQLGDLDEDGDLDAYVVNPLASDVVWLGDGAGGFVDAGLVLSACFGQDVALGDVDGDGNVDAVVACFNAGNEVWLGNGLGDFTDSGQALGANQGSTGVSLGDLDGDGDLDAFFTNANDEPGRVYLNNGAGVFLDSGQALGASTSDDVDLADVDNDGDLDAVVANQNGQSNALYLNDGAGVFADAGVDFGVRDTGGVTLADFNSDGFIDALFAHTNQNAELWTGDGAGDFANAQTLLGLAAEKMAVGDFDADGDLDAFSVSVLQQANELYLNDGAGVFTNRGLALGNGDSTGAAVGDFDGDGDLDVFVTNQNGEANTVWLAEPLPLTPVAQDPAAEAFGVPTNAVVTVTFDALAAEPGPIDTVLMHGSISGFIPVTVLANGNDLELTALADFAQGEEVTVMIGAGLQGQNLETLQNALVWQFRVEAQGGFGRFNAALPELLEQNGRDTMLADFDADGDLDLLQVNAGGQGDQVYLNDGRGNFVRQGGGLGTDDGRAVAMGDFDNDTAPDAIVANHSAGPNRVYQGRGDGTLTLGAAALGTASSADVVVGDFNGDGNQDAFFANEGSANALYFGQGDGTFVDAELDLDTDPSVGIDAGDFDGDGTLDVFVANNGAPDEVYLNNPGDGFFSAELVLGGNGASTDVALGDLDGDGDLDAFVTVTGSANLVYLGDGAGGLVDSGQTLGNNDSQAATLGDFDADGDLDVFVTNAGGQDARLYLNDGAGAFADAGEGFGNADGRGASAGDLDGDGALDLVVANNGVSAEVWLGGPNPLFVIGTAPQPYAPSVQADISPALTFDANPLEESLLEGMLVRGSQSGALAFDVAVAGATGTVTLQQTPLAGERVLLEVTATVLGEGNTGVLQAHVHEYDVAAAASENHFDGAGTFDAGATLAVALADLDGDGDLDVLTGNRGEPNRVFLGDGAGGFVDSGQALGTASTVALAVGDLDGDGDLDFYEANTGGSDAIYLNNGAGVFTDSGQAIAVNDTTAAALGDFDSDGDLDVFLATQTGDTARFNDGAGGFEETSKVLVNTVSQDVALADIDNSGTLDVVVAGAASNTVLLGDGALEFENGVAFGGNSRALALGDVDGDGFVDAVVATDTGVEAFGGDGESTFVALGAALAVENAADVALGDIDGDGDLDLLVASSGQSSLFFLNDGAGGFADAGRPVDGGDTQAVALGDVDGDGDLDAVTGNFGGDNRIIIGNLAPTLLANNTLEANAAETTVIDALTLQGTDADGGDEQVLFVQVQGPQDGFVVANGELVEDGGAFAQSDIDAGQVSYINTGGGALTDTMTLALQDSQGGIFGEVVVTIDVIVPDEPPTVLPIPDQTHNEGDTINLPVFANDPEGQPLTYAAAGLPSALTIDPDTGVISGAVDFEANTLSPYVVTITVSDGVNDVESAFGWTINNTNRPPTIGAGGPYEGIEGQTISLAAEAADLDGDAVAVTWDLDEDGQCDDAAGLNVEFTAPDGDAVLTIRACADDGQAQPFEDTTVTTTNAAPQIDSDPPLFGAPDQLYTHTIVATDIPDDPLTIDLLASPAGMALDLDVITWTPTLAQAQEGIHEVQIQVCDDEALCTEQSWSVDVAFEDADNDGVPDDCERAFGLDPTDGEDGDLDPDADNLTNRQECLDGTDPTDFDGPTAPEPETQTLEERVDALQPTLSVLNAQDPNGDPITHSFEVYSDPELTQLVASIQGQESDDAEPEFTRWQVDVALDDNTTYFWRSRAADPFVEGPFSPTVTLVIDQANEPPSIPAPNVPIGTADSLTPTLRATEAQDPEGDEITYLFELFEDANPDLPLAQGESPIPEITLEATLIEDQSYQWHVSAQDALGAQSDFSDLVTFEVNTTNTLPPAPTITSPAQSGQQLTEAARIAWEPVEDPDGDAVVYEVEVAADETFDPILQAIAPETGQTQVILEGLEEDQTFAVRVRAVDGQGPGPYAVTTFLLNLENTAPTAPGAVAPVEGDQLIGPQIEFVFSHASDLDSDPLTYTLRVFSQSSGEPIHTVEDIQPQDGDQTTLTLDLSQFDGYTWSVEATDDQSLVGAPTEAVNFRVIDPFAGDFTGGNKGLGCTTPPPPTNPTPQTPLLLLALSLLLTARRRP